MFQIILPSFATRPNRKRKRFLLTDRGKKRDAGGKGRRRRIVRCKWNGEVVKRAMALVKMFYAAQKVYVIDVCRMLIIFHANFPPPRLRGARSRYITRRYTLFASRGLFRGNFEARPANYGYFFCHQRTKFSRRVRENAISTLYLLRRTLPAHPFSPSVI